MGFYLNKILILKITYGSSNLLAVLLYITVLGSAKNIYSSNKRSVEWKPTIVYSKNALVWLDHKYYAAVISSVNENPKTAGEEFWKELGWWNPGKTYPVGEILHYRNKIWKATSKSVPGKSPRRSTWTRMIIN